MTIITGDYDYFQWWLEKSRGIAEPVEDGLAPDQDHHPCDEHHGDAELEGVAPTVMVCGIEKCRRLTVERKHIYMFNQK